MSEKIKIPLMLTAGAAAIVYGMLRENNPVFIAGILLAFTGYRLIRRNMKSSQQRMDNSDAPDSPGEE